MREPPEKSHGNGWKLLMLDRKLPVLTASTFEIDPYALLPFTAQDINGIP